MTDPTYSITVEHSPHDPAPFMATVRRLSDEHLVACRSGDTLEEALRRGQEVVSAVNTQQPTRVYLTDDNGTRVGGYDEPAHSVKA